MVQTDAYCKGYNHMSQEEEILCQVYKGKGRGDLADCVRRGRLFHRLRDVIGMSHIIGLSRNKMMGILNGLIGCMDGREEPDMIDPSFENWQRSAILRHQKDPDLKRIIKLAAQLRRERVPEVKAEEVVKSVDSVTITECPKKAAGCGEGLNGDS